ncbi:MAG: TonB C-terminal domain-containing protein [Dechloromonas agitata]|uniref:TonB C-terminal domain-containing protein n=1 Tax=Dechloromonas agitata TaxID=73030 RepID=A0A930FYL2_9RHOO|nr:TonB C-terminal domain-containing protein [Dechloromonas agitata]
MILERPEEPGKKYALALTVLVHLLLAAFLFFGVQWKRSKPEVYEVELWSPTPRPATQVVAPPPPPPASPPAARKYPEPKKPEPPKPEAKPQPKFDFSKELASETSQLKSSAKSAATAQQMAHAAAAEAEQRASANKRGTDAYIGKIRGKVRGNMVLPPGIQGNPEATISVEQLPTGEVLSVKVKRSSGNAALDRAIEAAIWKSSPLPKPDDPSLFQRTLEIKYRPFEE